MLMEVPNGEFPKLRVFPTREKMVDYMKRVIAAYFEADRLRELRLFPIVGRVLGMTPMPSCFLIDGDEQISLVDMPNQLPLVMNGCLVSDGEGDIPTIIDTELEGETPEPAQEEAAAEEQSEEAGEPENDEEDDPESVAAAVATVAGQDDYGEEPDEELDEEG